MTITKVIQTNDTVNGAAYINPNSLKIPSDPVQRVDSPAQNDDQFHASGVLEARLNYPTYYSA